MTSLRKAKGVTHRHRDCSKDAEKHPASMQWELGSITIDTYKSRFVFGGKQVNVRMTEHLTECVKHPRKKRLFYGKGLVLATLCEALTTPQSPVPDCTLLWKQCLQASLDMPLLWCCHS